jgi:hypothetical protein
MGLCGTKQIIRWAPEEDDGNLGWMEDYDGMMADMIKHDLSPAQWELDLAQEGLMNPPWNKALDLQHGPHRSKRIALWSKYKDAVHKLGVDRSDGMLKTAGMTQLGSSPYLQMRSKQWMDRLKREAAEAKNMNRRSSTAIAGAPSSPSKYLAAMEEETKK